MNILNELCFMGFQFYRDSFIVAYVLFENIIYISLKYASPNSHLL